MRYTNEHRRSGESGETLVETLVAVLISSLAMLMLAMAIQVAANLVLQGKTIADGYYEDIAIVAKLDSENAKKDAGGNDGSVAFTLNTSNMTATSDTIAFNGSIDGVTWVKQNVVGNVDVVAYDK